MQIEGSMALEMINSTQFSAFGHMCKSSTCPHDLLKKDSAGSFLVSPALHIVVDIVMMMTRGHTHLAVVLADTAEVLIRSSTQSWSLHTSSPELHSLCHGT